MEIEVVSYDLRISVFSFDRVPFCFPILFAFLLNLGALEISNHMEPLLLTSSIRLDLAIRQ